MEPWVCPSVRAVPWLLRKEPHRGVFQTFVLPLPTVAARFEGVCSSERGTVPERATADGVYTAAHSAGYVRTMFADISYTWCGIIPICGTDLASGRPGLTTLVKAAEFDILAIKEGLQSGNQRSNDTGINHTHAHAVTSKVLPANRSPGRSA